MNSEPDPAKFTDQTSPGFVAPAAEGAFAVRAATVVESATLATDEQDTYEQSRHRQILGFRKWLVPAIYALTVAWLSFVAASISIEQHRHRLSDAVLIAMLGAATANVLGLLVIVLKSLFPIENDRYDR
jgi:hypothetical protein